VKPTLSAVTLKSIKQDSCVVQVKYKVSIQLDGIELHGVDAGLSWLKGESLQLFKDEQSNDTAIYSILVEIESSCEFRARGFCGEEDYWEEGKNHLITRLADGTIELKTSHAILDVIEYAPNLPVKFSPTLKSVKVLTVDEKHSIVEVCYYGSEEIEGMELHGVDAGLSWLTGESIELIKIDEEGSDPSFECQLEVLGSCEFKARAYIADENLWEDGMNHRITRDTDGTIELESDDLYQGRIDVKTYPPVNYTPQLDQILQRIVEQSSKKTRIFQLIVDISIWINTLIADPLQSDNVNLLSVMMRNIKDQSRQYRSYKLDQITLPLIKTLYEMYTSAITFDGSDVRILVGQWEKAGFESLFSSLIDKVKSIENEKLGDEADTELRKMELWKYN
jgi:hypothetical protein